MRKIRLSPHLFRGAGACFALLSLALSVGCDSGLDDGTAGPAPSGPAALPSQAAADRNGGTANTLPTTTEPQTDSNLCTSNLDCALDPLEVGPCRVAVCVTESGRCELQNLPYGTLCDDGLVCTQGDACAEGVCVPEGPLSCDDENTCTQDSCDDAAGCLHVPLDGACDDANPCTVADTCAVGMCIGGEPAVCNDGDPCTTDGCAPDNGCTYIAHVGACDDGNACTTGDQCAAGQCAGQNITCSDGVSCTDDICDPQVGCTYLPDHAQCSPGDSCNNSICEVGVGCVTTPSNDGIPCNDSNACTQLDVCSQGVCLGSPLSCPGNGNPCHDPYCDIVFGCTTVDNSNPCDDGDICTYSDTCQSGFCQGITDPSCGGGTTCGDFICQSTENCSSCPFDCGDCGGGGGGSCCAISTGPGCDNANCAAAVCALDPYCCATAWDTYCVQCAEGGTGISSTNCAGIGGVCGCSGGGGGGGNNTCIWSNDGFCDEGTIWCDPGTDCTDCGTCW